MPKDDLIDHRITCGSTEKTVIFSTSFDDIDVLTTKDTVLFDLEDDILREGLPKVDSLPCCSLKWNTNEVLYAKNTYKILNSV